MDSTAVATIEPNTSLMAFTLRPDQVVAQMKYLHQIMQEVLKPDVHYGVIPGTEKKDKNGQPLPIDQQKKTLFKSGAEMLCVCFGLSQKLDIRTENFPGGHREYTILCNLFDRAGNPRGQGVGSAITLESKHRYRGMVGKVCPTCGEPALRRNSADYGGGYWCSPRNGGCNAKFKATSAEAKALDEIVTARAENSDPADQYNTILKMAKKRALVDAVLTATGASDMFTQDNDEDTHHDEQEESDGAAKAAAAAPKGRKKAEPAAQGPAAESTTASQTTTQPAADAGQAKAQPSASKLSPAEALNEAGRALWRQLNAAQAGSGSAIITRVAKLHGGTTTADVPAAKVSACANDIAAIAKALQEGGMASVEDLLGGWEATAVANA